ncbi:hypothetical protein K440DRAFT_69735 [Wilcoxina mikolae CBS 423.85]|nr:hypothetical protein K440DRAFT_69735 [Wilcoxina mikolae CBS 423.85]
MNKNPATLTEQGSDRWHACCTPALRTSQGDGLISSRIDAVTIHPSPSLSPIDSMQLVLPPHHHPGESERVCILFLLRLPTATSGSVPVSVCLLLALASLLLHRLSFRCNVSIVLQCYYCDLCTASIAHPHFLSLVPPSAYLPLAKGATRTWLFWGWLLWRIINPFINPSIHPSPSHYHTRLNIYLHLHSCCWLLGNCCLLAALQLLSALHLGSPPRQLPRPPR